MDNVNSQRNKEILSCEGLFYTFLTRNPLTKIEKCGDASVRTTVAERVYTLMQYQDMYSIGFHNLIFPYYGDHNHDSNAV